VASSKDCGASVVDSAAAPIDARVVALAVARAAASTVRVSYEAMRAESSSEFLAERGGGVGVAAGEGKGSVWFARRGGGVYVYIGGLYVDEKGFDRGSPEGAFFFL
jgi:streptogramin lyase